jgi:hypothetical protein
LVIPDEFGVPPVKVSESRPSCTVYEHVDGVRND